MKFALIPPAPRGPGRPLLFLFASVLGSAAASAPSGEFAETRRATADATLPRFQPTANLSGKVTTIGSDTMAELLQIWADGFKAIQPRIELSIDAKGSMTGAPALAAGRCQLAAESREMFPSEIEAFQKLHGYPPLPFKVALGAFRAPERTAALGIRVHRTNPIVHLSIAQLGEIFRVGGFTVWGQLGLEGEWAHRPIHPVGIAWPDGNANFIRHFVCADRDFTPALLGEKVGLPTRASARILADIAADPAAIGYAGFLYENAETRIVPVGTSAAGPFLAGTFEEIATARYPLTRFVYLYVNRAPGAPLDPAAREFLRYVLSLDGQRGVEREGKFLPLPSALAAAERGHLE